jgi:hypothetical protein
MVWDIQTGATIASVHCGYAIVDMSMNSGRSKISCHKYLRGEESVYFMGSLQCVSDYRIT